ncbi:MAG TPA: sulfotransferase domain-containing protein [Paracoccus sp.]|nr:sulfotransferase domain-containing protein [Paracoccus sp. (in: a-proteobacteria)]
MSARSNITDILCIGCQKASTSWLHSVLSCHPDTYAFPNSKPVTSTNKEAHFWDWNHARGVEWYRTLMTPPEARLLSMDFTPEYAFLPDAKIAECKALNPTARIIYILRDPLARAVSALRMHILWRFGPEHDQPLQLDDTFRELIAKARLDAHGGFVRNWSNWKRHYDDILVLNYEDFHNARAESVARVMAHIGLDPARMDAAAHAQLEGLMQKRVWKSTPFAIDRAVLHFLHGYTWRTRDAVAGAFGITFSEGDQLLAG